MIDRSYLVTAPKGGERANFLQCKCERATFGYAIGRIKAF